MATASGRQREHTNAIIYPRCAPRRKVLIDAIELDVAHEIGRILERFLVVQPSTAPRYETTSQVSTWTFGKLTCRAGDESTRALGHLSKSSEHLQTRLDQPPKKKVAYQRVQEPRLNLG
jgi:hypothetical protein